MANFLEKEPGAENGLGEVVNSTQATDKTKKFYKKWWFWAAIAVVIVVIILATAGDGTPSDLIDLPEAEYRAQCQTYSYDDFARSPAEYEKKLVKLTGKVVQVLRDGDKLQMRVDVTRTSYGYYEDTVFVFHTVKNGANVLEGDIVTMYGELRGLQEYETVLGTTVTIPRAYVKFIDVVG